MAKYNTGKGLPCGWALLPGESEEVYQLMLDGIMTKINTDGEVHKPQRIIVDLRQPSSRLCVPDFLGSRL
jgi:hypothetical protein